MALIASVLRQGRSVVVAGPAGVGKSALVHTAATECGRPTGTVRCLRLRQGLPRSVVSIDADVVLVVDDAQWLDDGSLEDLAEMARRRTIITAWRTEAPPDRRLSMFTSCSGAEKVDVGPLSLVETRRLVACLRPGLHEEELVRLVRRSAGIPYLAVQMSAAEPTGDGPPSDGPLQLVLAVRLAGLSSDARLAIRRALDGELVHELSEPDVVAEVLACGIGAVHEGVLQVAEVLRDVRVDLPDIAFTPSIPIATGRGAGLTARERQVLAMVADGASNASIATALGLCLGTVESHIRSAMAVLGARNRVHAARLWAHHAGSGRAGGPDLREPAARASRTKGSVPQPLIVVRGRHAAFITAVEQLRAAGHDVREGWDLDAGAVGPHVTRHAGVGVVRTEADASDAVAAAVHGVGVVAHVQGSGELVADLVENLRRLGHVDYREHLPARNVLSHDDRHLLALLGQGLTQEEAARRLYLSRRTTARRLAAAKRALGASSTVEAIRLAEESEGPWRLQPLDVVEADAGQAGAGVTALAVTPC